MDTIKKILKHIIKRIRIRKANHEAIFSDIYKNNVWGKGDGLKFYSGGGSDEINSEPYVSLIVKFIEDNQIQSVADLGCGDFRVGRKIIADKAITYMGIDVVESLIDYNNSTYSSNFVNFKKLNIVKDGLPKANLCLIRQVLQHLSNQDIRKVLKKLKQYDYVIITEHQPTSEDARPNLNKSSGASIRLDINSGLYLDKAPFNEKIKELLTVYPETEPNSKLVTFQLLA
jgi:hypothetical protein